MKSSNKKRTNQKRYQKMRESYNLENENERLSRLFQEEFCNSKLVTKDNHRLHRLNKELLEINAVLASSNKNLREKVEWLSEDLSHCKTDYRFVLAQLLRDGPECVGLEPEGALASFLQAVRDAPEKVMTSRLVEGNSIDKKSKRTDSKILLAGAKELASSLKRDVNKLQLKEVGKGKNVLPSERRGTRDQDKKAWSFCEDNEKQEGNFESKRDNIYQSFVLDGV